MLPYLEKGLLYVLAFLGCLFSYDFYASVKDMQKLVLNTNTEIIQMKIENKALLEKFDADIAILTQDRDRLGSIENGALFFAGIEQLPNRSGLLLKVKIPSGMTLGINSNINSKEPL